MADYTQFLAILDVEPDNAHALAQLEELARGGLPDLVARALDEARKTYRDRGDLELALRLFDVELSGVRDRARKAGRPPRARAARRKGAGGGPKNPPRGAPPRAPVPHRRPGGGPPPPARAARRRRAHKKRARPGAPRARRSVEAPPRQAAGRA